MRLITYLSQIIIPQKEPRMWGLML